MPVRIRLATNGAARNWTMVMSMRSLGARRLDRLDQQVDVVVEQLEVIAGLRHAADRGGHDERLAAGVRRDRVRRLAVEIRLDDDQLYALRLHRVDDVERVLRSRRDARLRLDVADDVEPERIDEIGPRAVVGDDLQPLVRRHLTLPAPD